jgi:hypothetical protein
MENHIERLRTTPFAAGSDRAREKRKLSPRALT